MIFLFYTSIFWGRVFYAYLTFYVISFFINFFTNKVKNLLKTAALTFSTLPFHMHMKIHSLYDEFFSFSSCSKLFILFVNCLNFQEFEAYPTSKYIYLSLVFALNKHLSPYAIFTTSVIQKHSSWISAYTSPFISPISLRHMKSPSPLPCTLSALFPR